MFKKTGFTQVDIHNYLIGQNCILAYETAADYLCLCNMCSDRKAYYVYAKEDLKLEGVVCILVDSLDSIPYIVKNDIKVTTEERTIIDLLRNDRDDQVIQEAMSYWYETHGQSFSDLNIPDDIKATFDSYVDDAIHYYDD